MRAVPHNRLVVFLLIAVLGATLDLATKHWAFASLGMPAGSIDEHTHWLIRGVFGFTTSLNEGALFGFGQGKSLVFAAMSLLAAGGIFFWLFVAGAASDWLLTVALGSVTAGILGNLYDRLGLPGLVWQGSALHADGERVFAVRDWLNFQLINWPIFNLADSFLVCGAALLVWHAVRHSGSTTAAKTPSSAQEA